MKTIMGVPRVSAIVVAWNANITLIWLFDNSLRAVFDVLKKRKLVNELVCPRQAQILTIFTILS